MRRAYSTVEGAQYGNFEVVGSSHDTDKFKEKKGMLVDGDLKEKFVLFKRKNDVHKMVEILLNRMYLDINCHCSKYYHIKLIERISRLGRVVRCTHWRKY